MGDEYIAALRENTEAQKRVARLLELQLADTTVRPSPRNTGKKPRAKRRTPKGWADRAVFEAGRAARSGGVFPSTYIEAMKLAKCPKSNWSLATREEDGMNADDLKRRPSWLAVRVEVERELKILQLRYGGDPEQRKGGEAGDM